MTQVFHRSPLTLLLLLWVVGLAAVTGPATAEPIWARGGTLSVCYPGNTTDLSSNGCPCSNSNQCRGTCSTTTNTCGGVTGVTLCAAGNSVKASADGCACQTNNECVSICVIATHSCGSVTNGQVCSPGNIYDLSAAGCPCSSSTECQASCSTTTDTCGGVVAAVEQNASTLAGTEPHPPLVLGGTTFDRARLSNGIVTPKGTITFLLFGPSQPNCTGTPLYSVNASVNGNAVYSSGSYMPTQTGIHRWVARYSGDAYNLAVNTVCGNSQQTFSVILDVIFASGFEST